jgi:hypothetical protein
MGLPQLDNLVRIRQLKLEPAAHAEIDGSMRSGHRKRNIAEYEGYLDIDQGVIEALIRVAAEVASRVAALGPVAR